MTQDPIIRDMLAHRDDMDAVERPSETLEAAVQRVQLHVRLLKELQVLGPSVTPINRSSLVRAQTLATMAACYRLLRDLGLATEGEAAEKDIPF